MSDRRLKVFHAVAELRSFTRAGQRLHMTQPAVTFQIRGLEEHFNTRLFDREHNRISLTEAGQRVFEYSDRILKLHAEMEASVRELTHSLSGLLVLGASTTIAEYVLPSVLVDFKNAFSEVVVRLLVSNTDGIVQLIGDNQVDLGMVEGPVHNKTLTSKLYHADQLVLVVPPGHPLAYSCRGATTGVRFECGRERLQTLGLGNFSRTRRAFSDVACQPRHPL